MGQDVFLFDPLAPDACTARYNPLKCIDRSGGPDSFDSVQKVGQAFFPEAPARQSSGMTQGAPPSTAPALWLRKPRSCR